jgi:hypothetical protein
MPPATNANGAYGDKLLAAQFTFIHPTQEDDLVEIEAIKDNSEEENWEDISDFIDQILASEDMDIGEKEE